MRKRYIPILILSALVLVLSIVSCKTVEAPVEYSVTYILNGGAWRTNLYVPSVYMSNGSSYKVPDPEKTGYTFSGWTAYSAENTIIAREAKGFVVDPSYATNLTLAAAWEPVVYSIDYDETIVELHDPEPVVEVPEGPIYKYSYTVEDADFLLPEPLPKAGLDFLGWKEKDGDMDPYVRYLVVTSKAVDYVFEAVWQYHTYSISYDLAGGQWDEEEPVTSFILTDGEIRIPAPYREHYDFLGWRIKGSDDTPYVNCFIDSADCTDFELEAVWKAHEYSIRLNYSDMRGDWSVMYYTILDEPFKLPVPAKESYDFAGWYAEGSDEKPVIDYTFNPSEGGNCSFWAAWTPEVFHIEYDLAGGYLPFDIENPATYTIDTESFTLVAPCKDHYVFLGWVISGDKNLTLHSSLTIEEGTTGDMKLYAIFQWRDVELGDVTMMMQHSPVLGKNDIPRPNWVVKVPEDDIWHYEKGYAKAGTFYDTLTLATKKAILAVAEWCGTDAYEYYYSNGTVSTDDLYLDTVATVRGREIAEYWEDAEGGVWVLVRVPADMNDEDDFNFSFFDLFGNYDYDDYDYDYDYDYDDSDRFTTDDSYDNPDSYTADYSEDSDDYLFDLLTLLFGE